MPEYPEVHVLIDNLKKSKLLNKKIEAINFIDTKILKNSSKSQFEKFLINEKIIGINQIGKLIVIHFSNNKYLTIHLRMEGKLFFVNAKDKTTPFTMIELICGKQKLIYEDFRKFGTFYIYEDRTSFLKSKEIAKIGLQPFDKDLTPLYLFNKCKNKSISIKNVLLNQSIIAGIGNIYASEILFLCKINPNRPAKLLSLNDCKNIIINTRKILILAIKHSGTTVFTYKFSPNHTGSFQKYLNVYSRENKPCKICGTLIKKIKISGRGTYYCPKCQNK